METRPVSRLQLARGWLRQLPGWKKAAVGVVALVVVLYAGALVHNFRASGGERGGALESSAVTARIDLSKAAPASPGQAARTRIVPAASAPAFAAAPKMRAERPYMPDVQTTAANALPSLETWQRQLILTASLALEVADVREAYQSIQQVAAAEGGLITSASLQAATGGGPPAGRIAPRQRTAYGHATVVMRMPQSRFYAVRDRLLELAPEMGGRVLRDEISSQDVTEEYVDLKARLRNWQSQETQLLAIMGQARRISDILSVRNQLAEVQQEIERITGRLRFLENRVDLSTITVEIYQKGRAKPPVKPTILSAWTGAGKTIAAASGKSLKDVVYVLGLMVAAVTYLVPFAIIIAVVWVIARGAVRRLRGAAEVAARRARGESASGTVNARP